MRFVYDIDVAHAVVPGPDLPARARAAALRRVESIGYRGVEITTSGNTLDIRVPASRHGAGHVRDTLSVVGHVELVPVADEVDPFQELENAEGLPKGLRIEVENAPLGPGKTAPRRYAFLPKAEGEPMKATLERMRAWASTASIPSGVRIAFEKVSRLDPDTEKWEDEGWRTFLLETTPILTGAQVDEAIAMPDQSTRSLGGWLVHLRFSSKGADLFAQATEHLAKRRFAIVLDGIVESAPVVQGRISGASAVITMGTGPLEEQEKEARRLELVFRTGALPAPLVLTTEDRVDPPLGPTAFGTLVALAALLLATLIVLALRVSFGSRPVQPAPALRP